MHITREGGRVFLRDRVALFWALGIFLFAGGALAIAMSLGLAENADELKLWERLAAAAVGLGVGTGGLWWLAQNPATRVVLDLTRRSVRLVRWGILGREVRQLPFDQLESALVEEGEDGDGGKVWRPAIRLRNGGVLPLSLLWNHDEPGARSAVATVTEVCGL
jgi:hypothetical protein